MKLFELLNEEKESPKLEEFADKRFNGAEKIANNAKEKGGPAMLTYHHFVVKLPYYKKAANGKLDMDSAKKEYSDLVNKLHKSGTDIKQVDFQKLVGKIEVLGELIIKNK
jgi:hypothetical protein